MESLKKTLQKTNVQYYKSKNTHLNRSKGYHEEISKAHNYTDINQLIESSSKVQSRKEFEAQEKIIKIILRSFQNGKLCVEIPVLIQYLLKIVEQFHPTQDFDRSRSNFNIQEQKMFGLVELLRQIDSQKTNEGKKQLSDNLAFVIQSLNEHIQKEVQRRKTKSVKQYEQIVNNIKSHTDGKTHVDQRKNQKEIQEPSVLDQKKCSDHNNTKLISSLSNGNLKVRKKHQGEIGQKRIFEEQNENSQKDQSYRVTFEPNRSFEEKQQRDQSTFGDSKLGILAKNTSPKVSKTKAEYDFNAILEASKTNIQSRNKTFQAENQQKMKRQTRTRNINDLNKAKKDQAFVFYRPKKV